MIVVSARCKVNPDACQEFVDEVYRIIPMVRAEPGCLRYELHADVFEFGLFVFFEEWASKKELDDHINTPHMQEYFSNTAEMLSAPVHMTFYDVSGTEIIEK